jgi:rhodanese-related sulfurtransferase
MVRIISSGLLLAAVVLLTIGCVTGSGAMQSGMREVTEISELPKNSRGYAEISPDQLRSFLRDKDLLLVNVNGAAEEVIPGTDFTVPFEELEDNLDRFPDKDQPTVLYCQAGPLSRAAARDLVELGFTNILWLDGGISAWKQGGFDVKAR